MATSRMLCVFTAPMMLALTGATPLSASIIVNSGLVDTSASVVTGRLGSAQTDDDDAPAGQGTSGSIGSTSTATAGPIAPDPLLPNILPGTDGVVTANGLATLGYTSSPGQLVIEALASTLSTFSFMDGGTYSGNASGYFTTTFTIDQPTPYTLTGLAAFDDQDVLASFFFNGPFGSVFAILGAGGNGPFSSSGVLDPGTYTMTGNAAINEVPTPNTGDFSESGSISATLTLVPSPAAAGLAGLAAVTALRRRRD